MRAARRITRPSGRWWQAYDQPSAIQDQNIKISNVLDGAWTEIGFAQLELQEDAKRQS
jgi:hypothetical protein